jgi:uncharacterized membrane protein HdeD (DUF308 family)
MIKVYAVALALGTAVLVGVIFWSSLPEKSAPGERVRMALGGLLGFGMGGMAAEYSPLDIHWALALVLAILAAVAAVAWVRFASRRSG